jgi:hypothetical protein
MSVSKPKSEDEVLEVMQKYAQTKGYGFSDSQLRHIAENCYLHYEGLGWKNCKYWPPWVMKWLLNQNKGVSKTHYPQQPISPKEKSVRQIILDKEKNVIS